MGRAWKGGEIILTTTMASTKAYAKRTVSQESRLKTCEKGRTDQQSYTTPRVSSLFPDQTVTRKV
jgi:hypothetical protein